MLKKNFANDIPLGSTDINCAMNTIKCTSTTIIYLNMLLVFIYGNTYGNIGNYLWSYDSKSDKKTFLNNYHHFSVVA